MRPRSPWRRPEDWPERLAAHVAAHRASGFAWGVHDCATFAADWVRLLHGFDPLAPWRGAYADEAGFLALLGPNGLGGLMATAAQAHGLPEGSPAHARRGDVALVRLGNEECAGIVDALDVAVPTLAGIRMAPRRAIARVWSV
jgi:hypothetical protein